MADELDGLLARVDDPALRTDLRAHIDRIRAKRTFGLVFESHLPERVRLPEHPIRVGVNVALRDEADSETYRVIFIQNGRATVRRVRHRDGAMLSADELSEVADAEVDVDALVVIADFGEPVYPGLRRLGSVDRADDKPFHVVIKGENHHVLEAMQFTHAGQVDCIYIDPPYNTGARDWKYDNNYVDDTDAYRHSKWLAFMERRLLLARELLNPENSVLIVTIDEKEYLRLGLLLEQIFVGCKPQMVSIVINPLGQARKQELARVEEYAFFVFLGDAQPVPQSDDLLNGVARTTKTTKRVRWEWLLRGGVDATRARRPDLFYPIFVDPAARTVAEVGEPLSIDADRLAVTSPPGTVVVWPLRASGDEGRWRCSPAYLRDLLSKGYAKVGDYDRARDQWAVLYLGKAQIRRIESGEIEVRGRASDGSLLLGPAPEKEPVTSVKTVWNRSAHRAGEYGTSLLRTLLPGRRFPYPKSLYAVEDALQVAISDKPNAIVLDFFGGSGTTAHAVARLNRQDGGRRQSIVVTNNEVSADEATALRNHGRRPGDPEWEALGIFEHITRPRITAAITGVTPEGEPVKDDYKFTDEFPMSEGFDENVEFMELAYLDPDDIELDLAFAEIAPLLWLRAGARGLVLDDCRDSAGCRKPFAWTEQYGVLFDPDRWRGFVEKVPATATTAFVVTDSQATFAGVVAELPDNLDVVRLYENYLTTFRINEGYS